MAAGVADVRRATEERIGDRDDGYRCDGFEPFGYDVHAVCLDHNVVLPSDAGAPGATGRRRGAPVKREGWRREKRPGLVHIWCTLQRTSGRGNEEQQPENRRSEPVSGRSRRSAGHPEWSSHG